MTMTKEEFMKLSPPEQKKLVLDELDKRINETQKAIELCEICEKLEILAKEKTYSGATKDLRERD